MTRAPAPIPFSITLSQLQMTNPREHRTEFIKKMLEAAESSIDVFHCKTFSSARSLYLNLCWRLNIPEKNLKLTEAPRYERFRELGVLLSHQNAHLTSPEQLDYGLATFLRESAVCLTESESLNVSTLLSTLISESSQHNNQIKVLNNLEVHSFILGLLTNSSNFSDEALFEFSSHYSAPLFAFVNELLQIFFMKDSARARAEIIKEHGMLTRMVEPGDNAHYIYLGAFSEIGDLTGSDITVRGTDTGRIKRFTAVISHCNSVVPSHEPVFSSERMLVATIVTPSSFEEKLGQAKRFSTEVLTLLDFTSGEDPFYVDASQETAKGLCDLRARSATDLYPVSVANDPVVLDSETGHIQDMLQCAKKLKKLQRKRRRSEDTIQALEIYANELRNLKENL